MCTYTNWNLFSPPLSFLSSSLLYFLPPPSSPFLLFPHFSPTNWRMKGKKIWRFRGKEKTEEIWPPFFSFLQISNDFTIYRPSRPIFADDVSMAPIIFKQRERFPESRIEQNAIVTSWNTVCTRHLCHFTAVVHLEVLLRASESEVLASFDSCCFALLSF